MKKSHKTSKKKKIVIYTVSLRTHKDYMQMLNRHAVLVRYKKPFIKWERKVNPYLAEPQWRIKNHTPLCLLFVKKTNETFEQWLKKNYKKIFEQELEEWAHKRDFPKKRTYKMFRRWIDVIFSDFIIDDSAGKPIEMI